MPKQDNYIYIKDLEEPVHLLDQEGIEDQLSKLLKTVQKGYEDSVERQDQVLDLWDIYNCKLNDKQFYSGETKIFVPFIHNAVNARKTRFVNQIFPQSKRHVECISTDGTKPDALLSLAEHYISATKLRTSIMPALCVNGDIEGQYSLYVSWRTYEREIKRRLKLPLDPKSGRANGPEESEAVSIEVVTDGVPEIEIIPDTDLVILPATADTVDHALNIGGSVTLIRRWTKARLEQLIEDGTIEEEAGETLLEAMEDIANKTGRRNTKKAQVEGMGIQVSGKEVEIYETWAYLKIKEEKSAPKRKTASTRRSTPSASPAKKKLKRRKKRKLCQMFLRSDGVPLGCRENPYWNGRCPVISVPVIKLAGSAKGEARVKFCADMQYKANDAINIAMDSAMYSLLPIVMTDPAKNPRVASMVLNMAAIWETSPNDTQFQHFPNLWKDGFEIAQQAANVIMQTLSVSPAAITQTGQKKKPTQAELSNEQAVDILTTADAVTVLEEGILTPLIQWFIELDYQYRDRDLTIKKYGPLGLKAEMESIEPLQMNERFEFRWLGVEAARNAQQVQQQIAAMNVLRGIPPQNYRGYELDLGPLIAQLAENTFGPRLAPLVFKQMRDQISQPAEQENHLLLDGFDVPVSPLDNDMEHIQAHQQVMQGNPLADSSGMMRAHIQKHMMSLQQKQAAQAPHGQPGAPGGAGPGQPGQPKPGAQPMKSPQGGQMPNGNGTPDQMRPARAMRGNMA